MLAALLADVAPFEPAAPSQFPMLPVAIGAVAVGVLLLFFVLFRRRARPVDTGVHGEYLADYPPPPPVGDCQLYYLNEPMRVRLVVLAPLGRRDLPEDVEGLLDRSVRGLGQVLAQDKPAWRTWPAQLSWKGFLPTLTRYVQMPDRPEDPSAWQIVCGQIRLGGQMVAIGLVLLGDEAYHRQTRLLEAHQWVEQCRVEWYE